MITSRLPPMASYWLLPVAEDEATFADAIRRLAARHHTPVFHPHLTLLGDLPHDPALLSRQTRALAASATPFSARIDDIVMTGLFFRSFYAAFAPVPALQTLRSAAQTIFAVDAGPFTPHISMLYGPVEPHAKAKSAAEFRAGFSGRTIRFDRLTLTNSANDVPIADWRMIETVRLGTPV